MCRKRIFAALLAVLMVLSAGVVPARAALLGAYLPDLAAFLGSEYTQNEESTYTKYVTCTYSDSLGTEPLEEYLALLQEDRYHLKLIKTGKSTAIAYLIRKNQHIQRYLQLLADGHHCFQTGMTGAPLDMPHMGRRNAKGRRQRCLTHPLCSSVMPYLFSHEDIIQLDPTQCLFRSS